MSTSFELDPVTRITAGAQGEPGSRIFYLQARSGDQLVTLLAEKEQIGALAASLEQLLDALPEAEEAEEAEQETEGELSLEEPVLPEWRIGPMALHYEESRDLIVLIASELIEAEESDDEPATARFVTSRSQARALAEHADVVVRAGRPRCRFCGFPMDAEGHICSAMNGHRSSDA